MSPAHFRAVHGLNFRLNALRKSYKHPLLQLDKLLVQILDVSHLHESCFRPLGRLALRVESEADLQLLQMLYQYRQGFVIVVVSFDHLSLYVAIDLDVGSQSLKFLVQLLVVLFLLQDARVLGLNLVDLGPQVLDLVSLLPYRLYRERTITDLDLEVREL